MRLARICASRLTAFPFFYFYFLFLCSEIFIHIFFILAFSHAPSAKMLVGLVFLLASICAAQDACLKTAYNLNGGKGNANCGANDVQLSLLTAARLYDNTGALISGTDGTFSCARGSTIYLEMDATISAASNLAGSKTRYDIGNGFAYFWPRVSLADPFTRYVLEPVRQCRVRHCIELLPVLSG